MAWLTLLFSSCLTYPAQLPSPAHPPAKPIRVKLLLPGAEAPVPSRGVWDVDMGVTIRTYTTDFIYSFVY